MKNTKFIKNGVKFILVNRITVNMFLKNIFIFFMLALNITFVSVYRKHEVTIYCQKRVCMVILSNNE